MDDARNDTAGKLNRRQLLKSSAVGGTALSLSLATAGSALASSNRPSSEGGGRTSGSEGLPTGLEYEIRGGNMAAVVTEEGATLRSLTVGGQEFLITFAPDQPSTFYHGQVLLPWSNRVAGGQYVWNGVTQQLPINEISHNSALHGLVNWMNWNVVDHDASSITLSLVLHARDGYPFVLQFWEKYAITPVGFEVFTTAKNIGSSAAPYDCGNHPYFTLSQGQRTINEDILRIPCQSYFKVDSNLIIIPPAVSVEGTQFDFRKRRPIGSTVMDTNFADPIFDADGYARTILAAPDGHPTLTLFMDRHHHYMQFYTSDTVPIASQIRKALVIEAYTGATNCFNNGLGLVVLQPGESITTHWGVSIKL